MAKTTMNFSWEEMLAVYFLINHGGAGILAGQATWYCECGEYNNVQKPEGSIPSCPIKLII